MDLSAEISGSEYQRRMFRFSAPRQQLKLALGVLAIALLFGALLALNSYAAYGSLVGVALDMTPDAIRKDLALQTFHYAGVTFALVLGYTFAVVGLAAAAVHRMAGPTVALERHVRSLKGGNYGARVTLRDGDGLHGDLARELNELAAKLQGEQA